MSSLDYGTRKRKRIDDFFSKEHTKAAKGSDTKNGSSSHISTHNRIPGLTIHNEFVSPQRELLTIDYLNKQTWRTDLARRCIHYGGTYCLMPSRHCTPEQRRQIESQIFTADPIPAELHPIIDRMVDRDIFTASTAPEFCIVNEYQNKQGISAHVENFRFASPVCGLTLLKGDWMRFHELEKPDDGSVRSGKAAQAKRTGKKVDVWLPRRSLLVMEREAREKWQHEIVRGAKDRKGVDWKRVSLTFRTTRTRPVASST
ncbi:uncharacterized protein AB675_3463 [Cyphellophora attinorum]|uniref:Alpha-ketoglutarate-dependent dioxygenase AlkB-like domain-containing protein n=1 Tax=Cyphellophora attinorum TaxID=1664694 RepID=A0A0N1NYY1_9EURO|nr:uncharacterized protein AB675_3463 [Phialophora attinorum]KPI39640.1 hypothetical protein AB675_3463 [Phialophora attinorum]